MRMDLTAMTTNFQGQTSVKINKTYILPMIVYYSSPYLLVIKISDFENTKIEWTSFRPWIWI